MSAETRLKSLNITLPDLPAPQGNYLPALLHNNVLYLSGQVPKKDGVLACGKVGADVSLEEAQGFARLTGLNMIAAIRQALGSLDRVAQVLHVHGMVNATADFKDHAKVINGCSDLLVDVFGDAGKHTRASMGASSLPSGMVVEISAVIAVKD